MGGGELAYTLLEVNPDNTLQRNAQTILRERFETYIPRACDTPDYDPEEFQKQMDVEIMKITLNPDTYHPTKGKYLVPKAYRTITREPDIFGVFRYTERELKKISAQFEIPYEKVMEEYGDMNCNLDKLVEMYSKQRYTRWTAVHDYSLAMGPGSELYHKIEQSFSYNEIEERKRFLGEDGLQALRDRHAGYEKAAAK